MEKGQYHLLFPLRFVRCGVSYCGAVAPRVTAALLGRFLPRLGPLATASGPFFWAFEPPQGSRAEVLEAFAFRRPAGRAAAPAPEWPPPHRRDFRGRRRRFGTKPTVRSGARPYKARG